MSKFEKYGKVTFSPTSITDKEEVHGLHKRAGGALCVQSDLLQNNPDEPDYVKHRTHYVEITENVIYPDPTGETIEFAGFTLYLSSENIVSVESFLGSTLFSRSGQTIIFDEEILEFMISMNAATDEYTGFEGMLITRTDNVTVTVGDQTCTVPKAGIYLSLDAEKYVYTAPVVKQIDEKFIPDSFPRIVEITETMTQGELYTLVEQSLTKPILFTYILTWCDAPTRLTSMEAGFLIDDADTGTFIAYVRFVRSSNYAYESLYRAEATKESTELVKVKSVSD